LSVGCDLDAEMQDAAAALNAVQSNSFSEHAQSEASSRRAAAAARATRGCRPVRRSAACAAAVEGPW
jgi:hypothetical protein